MFTTLISAENLNAHHQQADWVIFDCRHDLAQPDAGRLAYREAHIPGAFFAHLDQDLAGPKTGTNGRHPLPDPVQFVQFLRSHGVNDSTQVVGYDASGGIYAARLWWLLRWIGHESVAVLDGGLGAWSRAGLPLEDTLPRPQTGTVVQRTSAVARVDAATLLDHLDDGTLLVIDARAADRYRGDTEPLDPVAGHIPHAINRFYQNNLASDGRFKPAADLRAEFFALTGPDVAGHVVHQCGSGVTACHNLLAMEVAGLHGTALYPGSWSEWCASPSRPVARG
jgi:thiosulfate/3-mercaptopyruvate sulfurtransferase